MLPAGTLELWKNTGIAPEASKAGAGGTTAASTKDENAELWWWVLALLAVLAVAESVLGNRHISEGAADAA